MTSRARVLTVLALTALAAGFLLTRPDPSTPAPVSCQGLLQVLPGLCTHGDDPRGAREQQGTPEATSPASGVPCDGDGVSGPRVQVIVARSPGAADHSSDALSQVNAWAAGVDSEFDRSAQQTGGHRRVRWVQNSDCTLHVENLELRADTFGNTITDLVNSGHTRTDRKYMVIMDASVYCGIATIEPDDSGSVYNASNYRTGYARVDRVCWNSGTMTHELGHNLGAVQLSAPHSDGSWHCNVESSIMCYGGTQTYLCPPENEPLFDCTHDSHYSTNPQSGSYLATHLNVANSVFLIGGMVAPPSPTPSPPQHCFVLVVKVCR